jgi:hypothetical protein
MAEQNKSQSLEGIINEIASLGGASLHVEHSLKRLKEDPTDVKNLESYMQVETCPPEMKPGFYEMLKKKSAMLIAERMNQVRKEHESALVEKVSENYHKMVNESGVDYLLQMALSVSGVEKLQKTIAEAVEKKDFDALKKMLAKRYSDNKNWVKYVMQNGTNEDVQILIQGYVQHAVQSFLSKYFDETEENGEKVAVPNVSKLREYLSGALDGADDKQKASAYLGVGRAIYNAEVAKAQKAEEAKKDKKE